ncbi:MAG: ABC transporter ATP-binding protein, partial [Ruminococcus sp.]
IHALNQEKHTTVILTTHDMGDVDALCQRIVIIDHGKMLYDNDIAHLQKFFGCYRTLKLRLKEAALEDACKRIQTELAQAFPAPATPSVSVQEEWVNIVIDEDKLSMMDVLNTVQHLHPIEDIKLEELSTEQIIRKIYEEGVQ